jgi:hypothetical protein
MKPKWHYWIFRLSLLLVVFILALSACAQAAAPEQLAAGRDVAKSVEQPVAAPQAPAEGVQEMEVSNASDAGQGIERIVIKNANMTIVVVDPVKSMDTISRMADDLGGYVVSANMYKEQLSSGIEVPRVSITIRVPAEKLNQVLERIRSESNQEPLNESVSSQDVTQEYVDLQSRLKNLEAAEKELTEIMQSAKRTEDVLAVYNQLVQIREQIEVTKGQIQYYEQSAALSSVSVELIADKAVQPIQIAGWKPEGIIKNAIEALIKTMQSLVSVVIWLMIYVLPVLLVLFIIFVLPVILIIRAWRRRRAKQKATVSEQNPPQSEA